MSARFGAPKTTQAALFASIANRPHHAAVLTRMTPSKRRGRNSSTP